MTAHTASALLASAPPRFPLLAGPTPVHELSRLRGALGGPSRCPRLWIKRDDLAGPALGGNKARKLEFVVADALAAGATHLITVGAVQSNHARMTAAAACMAGLGCTLVLTTSERNPGTRLEGNLLLDRLFGARIRLVAPGPDGSTENPHEAEAIREETESLRAAGERPYMVAIGASMPVGTLGYVMAMEELRGQLDAVGIAPARLYFGAGSRGTQAGVVLGTKLAGAGWMPHGIAVSPGDPAKTARAVGLANDAAALLGSPVRVTEDEIVTHQEFYGAGYALPTDAAREAIHLMARTEGILTDPVYTGKTLSGLLAHVRGGEIDPGTSVVFLHTGGAPAIFTEAGASALGVG